jgi:hypothetical protein
VVAVNLKHENHETSAALYAHYPDQRRPKGVAADETNQMLQVIESYNAAFFF